MRHAAMALVFPAGGNAHFLGTPSGGITPVDPQGRQGQRVPKVVSDMDWRRLQRSWSA